jgi:hypothetical protein
MCKKKDHEYTLIYKITLITLRLICNYSGKSLYICVKNACDKKNLYTLRICDFRPSYNKQKSFFNRFYNFEKCCNINYRLKRKILNRETTFYCGTNTLRNIVNQKPSVSVLKGQCAIVYFTYNRTAHYNIHIYKS